MNDKNYFSLYKEIYNENYLETKKRFFEKYKSRKDLDEMWKKAEKAIHNYVHRISVKQTIEILQDKSTNKKVR